eukprot:COSAG02_NODE_29601_length_566_cov_1.010707_2_plen_29_part_01
MFTHGRFLYMVSELVATRIRFRWRRRIAP